MTALDLRTRLGLPVAIGASVLTAMALLAVGNARLEEQRGRFDDEVSLAAFRLSETRRPASTTEVEVPASASSFAVFFDAEAGEVHRVGDVPAELDQLLIDDVWSRTTDELSATMVVFDDLPDLPDPAVVAGVLCADPGVCDTVVVGAVAEGRSDYVQRNWPWWAFGTLGAGLIAWFLTRLLVGRALRPVERMRSELDEITATDLDRRMLVQATDDELERLGRSMNETVGRLGAAVTANERFVADAAHELRSPITGVRAALELERSGIDADLIDRSIAELDRANRLVDDLLTLARRQGRSVALVDVDLDDVVRAQLAAAEMRFAEVRFERSLAPTRVVADADDLGRVAANLLDNACRYGNGRVAVQVHHDGDRAVLRVDDDGPGVPPEARDFIFERFARLDESRSRATGGSGLGLAIVREVVESLGGEVAVDDSPLGGASVVGRLPSGAAPR